MFQRASGGLRHFDFQLALLFALLIAFAIQVHIVYPLEKFFVPEEIVTVVSLLFLPFGLKIIFAALGGSLAVMPIFFSHLVVEIYFGNGIEETLVEASVGVAIVYLPIILFNFVGERPLMAKLDLTNNKLNIFRYIIVLAFCASVLNAFIHTVIHQDVSIDLLAFRFVIGDLGGTIVLLGFLIIFKQLIIGVLHNLMRAH